MISLFKNEKGMNDVYFSTFKDYYNTGDSGYFDEDGYLFVMTRSGDIINVAGHRLSTGSIEECLSNHPSVAECAVIGINDEIKGQVPLGLIVLSSKNNLEKDEVIKECIHLVRKGVGPVAAFNKIIIVC